MADCPNKPMRVLVVFCIVDELRMIWSLLAKGEKMAFADHPISLYLFYNIISVRKHIFSGSQELRPNQIWLY